MNKKVKLLVLGVIFIGLFFLIKSRKVSKSVFDLMVLTEQVEVLEACKNRYEARQKDKSISFEDISYNDKLFYNYHIAKNGEDICSDHEKLKKMLTKYYKDYYRKEWKFIY